MSTKSDQNGHGEPPRLPGAIASTPVPSVEASPASPPPARCIEAAADSHVGRRRQNNEDSFACLPELGLFLVADGLGGKAAGEVASRMAVDVVQACFEDDDPEETLPHVLAQATDRDEARLVLSLRRANRCIFEAARRDIATRGMGTTVAAVLLSATGAYIAHVGDSRVYRLRGGRLEQLTRDHSLLEELARHADLTWDHDLPDRDLANTITRALGTDARVEVETRVEQPELGDVFLLCSDGLWGVVPDAEIAAILGATRDLPNAIAALIDLANARGGPDNVTCVLARLAEP